MLLRLALFSGAVVFASIGPRLAAQDAAPGDRGPRFLYAATSGAVPRRVDTRNTPVLRHQLALDLDGATVSEALDAITAQTGLAFVYNPALVPADARVHLRASQITVAAALTEILIDADVDVLFSSARQAALLKRPGAVLIPPPGAITGRVTDARTGVGLSGAELLVEGTRRQASTDADGRYRLADVPAGTYTVTARRIGYGRRSQTVTIGSLPEVTADFALEQSALNLDEVVVTGTVDQASERSVGNSVGRVKVADAVVMTPPAKLQDLLSVNVPGVRVMRSGGSIGAGGTTRIRGSGSLSLSNSPLIYVDGVRVNNDGAAFSDAFQGQNASPSRINDLNPEEIESIEIVKGPAAATIYGTEASNGVIQILTKRGRASKTTIDAHLDAGTSWLMNPEGRFPANYYVGRDGQVHEFNVLRFQEERGFPSPFSTGFPIGSGASIAGGNDQLRYFFSGDVSRDESYVDYNWQNKYGGRANLNYTSPSGRFAADVSLGAVRSKLRTPGAQGITASIHWACQFPSCEPDAADSAHTGWNGPGHGFTFYRPEDYEHVAGWETIDRTTLSLRLSHTPYRWLRHHLTLGPDFVNSRSQDLVDRDATGYAPFFNASDGTVSTTNRWSTYFTADYGISADLKAGRNGTFTTSAGAQYYFKSFGFLHGGGSVFAVPGPSDLNGTAQRSLSEGQDQANKTFGVYAQEQLAWKNRLFLTAALRADDNSAFGSEFNAVYYPKFSVSWVASEEPFLAGSSFLSQLKLRAAWGRAGQQPDAFSALRTYQGAVGSQGVNGVTPRNLGNPNLRPEVGEELELGFDAALLNQRVGVQFTFYHKEVRDAILSVPLKTSHGFPGFQFVNIGKTLNKGVELALDGTVISSRNLGLDLRFTIGTNANRILSLGTVPPTLLFGSSQQYNVEGFAPSAYFFKRVVGSTIATTDALPFPIGTSVQCEGGTDLGAGNGSIVPCAQAPRLYAGQPQPKWSGSFSAELTLARHLRLLALVDYVGGYAFLDNTILAMHSAFLNTRAVLSGSDPILSGYIGLLYNDGDNSNAYRSIGLINGGFAKLRTVSASYELPSRVARWVGATRGSITVSGENLAALWRAQPEAFGVKVIDPESFSNRSGDLSGNLGFAVGTWPETTRLRTTVRLTF